MLQDDNLIPKIKSGDEVLQQSSSGNSAEFFRIAIEAHPLSVKQDRHVRQFITAE